MRPKLNSGAEFEGESENLRSLDFCNRKLRITATTWHNIITCGPQVLTAQIIVPRVECVFGLFDATADPRLELSAKVNQWIHTMAKKYLVKRGPQNNLPSSIPIERARDSSSLHYRTPSSCQILPGVWSRPIYSLEPAHRPTRKNRRNSPLALPIAKLTSRVSSLVAVVVTIGIKDILLSRHKHVS
jgi:hypothetical protein